MLLTNYALSLFSLDLRGAALLRPISARSFARIALRCV